MAFDKLEPSNFMGICKIYNLKGSIKSLSNSKSFSNRANQARNVTFSLMFQLLSASPNSRLSYCLKTQG